jgi:hypothetical protein
MDPVHLLWLFSAWQGATGQFGWKRVVTALPSDLLGPCAYVIGQRFLLPGLRSPEKARALLKEALRCSSPGSRLRRLTEASLKDLQAGTPPDDKR